MAPVICPCKREFKNIISFNNHRRVCKIPVPPGGKAPGYITPDVKVTSNIFTCDVCAKQFKHATSLHRHQQKGYDEATLTAKEPKDASIKTTAIYTYPRPFCGKTYKSLQSMCRHRNDCCASDAEQHICFCGRVFSSYPGLRQHMKKTHPDEYYAPAESSKHQSISAEDATSSQSADPTSDLGTGGDINISVVSASMVFNDDAASAGQAEDNLISIPTNTPSLLTDPLLAAGGDRNTNLSNGSLSVGPSAVIISSSPHLQRVHLLT